MSLVNPNDLIIPNTVGVITAAVKEANRHLDRYREHNSQEDAKNKNMSEYIREMQQIQYILQGRISEVPLEQLVDKTRIASDSTRGITKEEALQNRELQAQSEGINKERAYENWFRE